MDTVLSNVPIEPPRPWTPSYSVHSQGSLPRSPAETGQEEPTTSHMTSNQRQELHVEFLDKGLTVGEGCSVDNIVTWEQVVAQDSSAAHDPTNLLDATNMPAFGDKPAPSSEEQVAAHIPFRQPTVPIEDVPSLSRDADLKSNRPSLIPQLILDEFVEVS